MKQSKLILISILSGIFLLLCGVLIWGITGLNIRVNGSKQNIPAAVYKDYKKVLEVEVPAERIELLTLFFDKNSNDIYFYKSDSEQILIEEYVNWELSEKEKTKVFEGNGMLTLDSPRRDTGIINFGVNNKSGYVNVYLPESYQGDLTAAALSGDIDADIDFILGKNAAFVASTTSGEILLLKVEAETVDISSVSGDVDADIITGKTDISTTSGEVDVTAITGDCNVSTVSGDITINSVTGKADFSTTSGDVKAENLSGDGKGSTVSGDIRMHFVKVDGDITINTTSGIVDIYIPENTTVDFESSTTSGSIDTFFDDDLSFNKKGNHASGTYGDGEAIRMEIYAVSGDVSVWQSK